MALRLNSLKTRMALTTTVIIAVVLVANAAYLFLARRAELRRDVEARAMLFAVLTSRPICEVYETYYSSGFYKFREVISDFLKEPNTERILIASVNGEILFDSTELEDMAPGREGRTPRLIQEADRLQAVKELTPTQLPAVDSAGGPAIEIVAPYTEDWGRRKLAVLYRVHYRNLPGRVMEAAHKAAGILLLSILASVLGTVVLTSRIAPSEAVPPPG